MLAAPGQAHAQATDIHRNRINTLINKIMYGQTVGKSNVFPFERRVTTAPQICLFFNEKCTLAIHVA